MVFPLPSGHVHVHCLLSHCVGVYVPIAVEVLGCCMQVSLVAYLEVIGLLTRYSSTSPASLRVFVMDWKSINR